MTVHPAGLRKHGTGYDLAIAVAILTASGKIPATAPDGCAFTAELGLDGTLRPVPGILPALLAASGAGCTRAVVAPRNAAEAMNVPGIAVVPCQNLRALIAWLRHEPFSAGSEPDPGDDRHAASLAGPAVPPSLRLVLEASAAGGHHLCLTGPHNAAIPALAEALAGLLPPLSPDDAMRVSAIHSAAGLLGPGRPLITRPPFRAPHHTAPPTAILGSAGPGAARPGEASLAHLGVLFLGDAPEFDREVLRALRQPLQHGQLTVARSGTTIWLPARFTLVTGTAPCPCGARPDCACTALQASRYRGRLAGELGAHIAIWSDVPGPAAEATEEPAGDAGAISRQRVAAARELAGHRLRGTPWRVNAEIPAAQLHRFCRLPAEDIAPVRRAVGLGQITRRTAGHVLRVAWTLADLDGSPRPGPRECGQALAFQLGTSR